MRDESVSISLLVSVGLALAGHGLLGTIVALHLDASTVSGPVAGAVLAAYFAGLAVGTTQLPATIERIGHIRAFATFAALAVAVCLAHALIPPSSGWAGLRFVSGLCMAGIYLTVESWLNALASPKKRGRILAAYMAALYLGLGAGQFLLLILPGEMALAYVAAGLLASLAGVPIGLSRVASPTLAVAPGIDARALWQRAPLGAPVAIVSGFVTATIFANGPVFAQAQQLGAPGVSALMGAFMLGGLAGQPPLGFLSDRFDRRGVLVGLLLGLVILAGVLATGRVGSLVGFFAVAFAFGALAFGIYPLAVAITHDRVGPELAMPASSQLLLASSLGAVSGPILASIAVARFGAGAVFALDGAVAGALAFGVILRMIAVRPTPQHPYHPYPRTTPIVQELDPPSAEILRAAAVEPRCPESA